ncbi:1-acyl-sn-glycerol-3-phosphate acyltransferase [soil metagenome]
MSADATVSTAAPYSRSKPTPAIIVGSLVFTAWMYLSMAVLALVCLPTLLGPRRFTLEIVRLWAAGVLGALRLFCGVKVEVRGREHMPTAGGFIAAKHFAMLDTIAPLLVLPDAAYVLKRELMRLPFYGWYARKLDMLPIDRAGGAGALRLLVHGARERMEEGRQVLIFPEGTRREPGDAPDYKPGVAGLYRELQTPCTPLATNSGLFWPAHGFLRFPGTVVFEFLEPIPPGLKRGAFMAQAQARIEEASTRLLNEAA